MQYGFVVSIWYGFVTGGGPHETKNNEKKMIDRACNNFFIGTLFLDMPPPLKFKCFIRYIDGRIFI
jgi:hypothetical protein